jgi:hypothetical protein
MDFLKNYYSYLDDIIVAMIEDLEQLISEEEDLSEFIEIWEDKKNTEIKFIEKVISNLGFTLESRDIKNKLGCYISRMSDIIRKNKEYFIQ